jgi:hypothetical protein
MSKLIEINYLRRVARARGFEVSPFGNGAADYAEISNGLDGRAHRATGHYYGGCAYSSADYIINDDRPCTWPFTSPHPGFARIDSHGVKKLLAHPRMQDIAEAYGAL